MLSTTLRNLSAHRRRFVGIALAIFIGVAFLSGTLAVGDTLNGSFKTLFAQSNAGTDAIVRSATQLGGNADSKRVPLPAGVLDRVRAVDGVAAAAPNYQGYGAIVGRDGKAIGGNGPPRFAANWITDPKLTPYRLAAGHAPHGDREVVINRGAAKDAHLHVGDTATIELPQPVKVRVVGIATFGDQDGVGPTTYTAFSTAAAAKLLGTDGRPSQIAVAGDPGVSQKELVRRVQRVLPDGVEALTGQQLVADNVQAINDTFLGVVRTFLTVFAVIALVVAAFSIYNTFGVVAAQRSRETALLRALGATPGQVRRSGVAEALLVAVLASVAGVAAGAGLALGLIALLHGVGMPVPSGTFVFTAGTAITALAAGIGSTLLAGAVPLVHAGRTPPLAALRDAEADGSPPSIARNVTGAVFLAAGISMILLSAGASTGAAMAWAGLGALASTVAVVLLLPVAARTATRLLGWPAAKLRPATGGLARANADRNPRRAAGTASALMIGVAVVTLFTIFAASLKSSTAGTIDRAVRSDLVVSAGGFGGGGFSPRVASSIAQSPGVRTASAVGTGEALYGHSSHQSTIVDSRTVSSVLDLDVSAGSLSRLGAGGFAVSKQVADDHDWKLGTPVRVTLPDGARQRLRLGAIFDRRGITADYVLPSRVWNPHALQPLATQVYVDVAPGASVSSVRQSIERTTASFGKPDVLDRAGYVDQQTRPINMMLGLVYALLLLAIVIALLGIANTLSPSIHERTRELGLFRAVGGTRRQVRAMVRWESVLLALFGTVAGIALGAFLSWGLVRAVTTAAGLGSFTAPIGQLVIVLVVGAVAGVLAGIRPARRAARLDILQALGTE